MIKFPDGYFKDEIREGFLVSEMMKRAWGSQFELLDRIRNLCEKYDITYFAEVGTLLGAVRHKGIIPWDDDIDIAMLREEYHRFLEHADEIGDGVCVRSIYSSDSFYNFHAIVTHEALKLEWDEDRMEHFHGCPFICSVDIFPLDYYPKDPEELKFYQQLYCLAYKTVYDCMELENSDFGGKLIYLADVPTESSLYSDIRTMLSLLPRLNISTKLDEKKPLRNQLCRITDMVARSCKEEEAIGVEYCPKLPLAIYSYRNKEYYKEAVKLPFEMTDIAVPKDYREALADIYGEDYMTPVRGAAGHNYPFWGTEVNVLIGGDIGELYLYPRDKKNIVDTLDILDEALIEVNSNAYQGNISISLDLIGQMQELAASIGTFAEDKVGTASKTIANFEKYCDDLYRYYDRLKDETKALNPECEWLISFTEDLNGNLKAIRRSVFKEMSLGETAVTGEKKTVLIGVSAAGIVNNTYLEMDKIRELVNKYAQKDERAFVFVSEGLKAFLTKCQLEIAEKYPAFLEEIKNLPNVTVSENPRTTEIDRVLGVCDSYIGDRCRLSELCTDAGMDINILDYNR